MKALLDAYRAEFIEELNRIDLAAFERFIQVLVEAYRGDRQIFVVGNGGSAASANHFACDFGKNAVPWDRRRFRIHSLCDNAEALTALGNDIAFDQIFAFQLGNLLREGDVLIAISASGNSPDLVEACKFAREHGGRVVALSGFGGGTICEGAEVVLKTDMRSYERIEDLHMMMLHMVVCWFKAHHDIL